MLRTNWWRPIPALALLLAGTLLSASAGAPQELPGLALGWPLLLHFERGALLVAGLALVVLVGARATLGQFPARLGQIEYAVGEFGKEAGRWEERLTEVEAAVDGLDLKLRQQI